MPGWRSSTGASELNYEKVGDYKRVGDFHFGEMEMHRLASPWRRFVSWYSLYWALNGYGERPLRALFMLVGLIFAISAVVWSLGTESYLNTLLFILEKSRPATPCMATGNNLGREIVEHPQRNFHPWPSGPVFVSFAQPPGAAAVKKISPNPPLQRGELSGNAI